MREKLVATKADKVTAELTKDIAETVKLRLKGVFCGASARAAAATGEESSLTLSLPRSTPSLADLVGAGARYKLFTHVVLGEGQGKSGDAPPRGAGLHVSTRCLWDPTCDGSVCEVEATVRSGGRAGDCGSHSPLTRTCMHTRRVPFTEGGWRTSALTVPLSPLPPPRRTPCLLWRQRTLCTRTDATRCARQSLASSGKYTASTGVSRHFLALSSLLAHSSVWWLMK